MRKSYTQFRTRLQAYAKKSNAPLRDFINWWLNCPDAEEQKDDGDKTPVSRMFDQAEMDALDGNASYVFMPDRLFCNWLVNSVSRLDLEYACIVFGQLCARNIILLFPVDAKLDSCMTSLAKKESGTVDPTALLLNIHNLDKGNLRGFVDQALFAEVVNDYSRDDDEWGEIAYYIKLILGLGMYLSCFPEMMHNGVPDDLKKPSYHKYKRSMVVGTGAVTVGNREGMTVSSHYRRGHFRVLKSERFTKKRFQVVFVHDTFVKGKAATVEGI